MEFSPFHIPIWKWQSVNSFTNNDNNDGTLSSIINSSKFSLPWENGDQLLENQEENKSLYPDCALFIQGLLSLPYCNRNHNHNVWPLGQHAQLNTFLLNAKLSLSSESDFQSDLSNQIVRKRQHRWRSVLLARDRVVRNYMMN